MAWGGVSYKTEVILVRRTAVVSQVVVSFRWGLNTSVWVLPKKSQARQSLVQCRNLDSSMQLFRLGWHMSIFKTMLQATPD